MSCCRRITIEDPVNVFRSDTGWISVYRSPGGVDIRLDDSPNPGAAVNADCDFMLVKLTYWGRDFPTTVGRACWAVAEFRIRGMSTSIFFLHAVLDDPNFQAGRLTTLFIDEWPQLLTLRASADRDTKIPNYLADTVNRPDGLRSSTVYLHDKLPDIDLQASPPTDLSSDWLGWCPSVLRAGCGNWRQ